MAFVFQARRQASGTCLSDQESLASMSISRINGSTGGMTPTSGPPVPLSLGGLLPGDRGSCSADSGVRGSSDRESGGATSGGGNLSDSTTDGNFIASLFFSFILQEFETFTFCRHSYHNCRARPGQCQIGHGLSFRFVFRKSVTCISM